MCSFSTRISASFPASDLVTIESSSALERGPWIFFTTLSIVLKASTLVSTTLKNQRNYKSRPVVGRCPGSPRGPWCARAVRAEGSAPARGGTEAYTAYIRSPRIPRGTPPELLWEKKKIKAVPLSLSLSLSLILFLALSLLARQRGRGRRRPRSVDSSIAQCVLRNPASQRRVVRLDRDVLQLRDVVFQFVRRAIRVASTFGNQRSAQWLLVRLAPRLSRGARKMVDQRVVQPAQIAAPKVHRDVLARDRRELRAPPRDRGTRSDVASKPPRQSTPPPSRLLLGAREHRKRKRNSHHDWNRCPLLEVRERINVVASLASASRSPNSNLVRRRLFLSLVVTSQLKIHESYKVLPPRYPGMCPRTRRALRASQQTPSTGGLGATCVVVRGTSRKVKYRSAGS